jgi:hypothetical protein
VVVALVAVVALLLAGGVGGALVVRDAEPRASTAAEAPPADGLDLRAVVAELSAFVSSARGLAFKADVEVVLLENEAFRDRLLGDAEFDADEIESAAKVLRALGLLEGDVDLRGAFEDLLGAAVIGFYDPETGELVVRGADPTPAVRITLVHELTHALQDQHFELHRPELDDADDERGQAFDGLVEGDAERVAEVYRASLSAQERKEAEREQVAQSAALALAGDIPRVLIDLLTFPYVVGPSFVAAVHGAGPGRLDAAFTDPPTTTEHLLHPDRFLQGEVAVDVAAPAAEGEVIDEGVLGQLGLLLMLQDAVPAAEVFRAADGWGGDWYVAWDDGDVTCVRAEIAMDSPDDARELRVALDAWAASHPEARIEGAAGGRIDLTACA